MNFGAGQAPADCARTANGAIVRFTATARDRAGNSATVSGSYRVIYRFDGFLRPKRLLMLEAVRGVEEAGLRGVDAIAGGVLLWRTIQQNLLQFLDRAADAGGGAGDEDAPPRVRRFHSLALRPFARDNPLTSAASSSRSARGARRSPPTGAPRAGAVASAVEPVGPPLLPRCVSGVVPAGQDSA